MNETAGAASWMTLVLVIIFTVINIRIYHKLFQVVYFNLGRGLFKEIFFSLFIAFFEAGIVIKLFAGIIGIVGKGILIILKLLLILAVVAIVVGIIWKIVQIVQGKSGKENILDDLMHKNTSMTSENKEMTNVCKKCGKRFPNDKKFCIYCGEKLEKEESLDNSDEKNMETTDSEDTMKEAACPKCGKTLTGNGKFCIFCGEKIENKEQVPDNTLSE